MHISKDQDGAGQQGKKILKDLAKIIEEFDLPIVVGGYQKDKFGDGHVHFDEHEINMKRSVIHMIATMDCATWADRWLGQFAPQENAMIVGEDADHVKPMIKRALRLLRNSARLETQGVDFDTRLQFGLPLQRIIDTVHFAAKADSKPLQLADLCAFSINRVMKGKPMDNEVFDCPSSGFLGQRGRLFKGGSGSLGFGCYAA